MTQSSFLPRLTWGLLAIGCLGWLSMLLPTTWAQNPSAPPVAAKKTTPKIASKTTSKTTSVETPAAAEKRSNLHPFLIGFYIFLLSIFVGFELISKVPPTLHTPLMSGANAISGITIVGALFCARTSEFSISRILGFLAVAFAMVNVVGGFLVTDRMLQMFKSKK